MSKQSEYTAIQLNQLLDMCLEYSEKFAIELILLHVNSNQLEIDNMIREVIYER